MNLQPDLDVALWNGLFVHKDTPDDVRAKIAAVAKKVMMSDKAQKISKETGALVYWKDAKAASAQIEKDTQTLGTIAKLIAE